MSDINEFAEASGKALAHIARLEAENRLLRFWVASAAVLWPEGVSYPGNVSLMHNASNGHYATKPFEGELTYRGSRIEAVSVIVGVKLSADLMTRAMGTLEHDGDCDGE